MPGPDTEEPSLARRIAALAGAEVTGLRAAGAQHGWRHYLVTLANGREAFAKVSDTDRRPPFEAEARGLRWLAEAGAVPVPEVLGWDGHALVMARVPAGAATPEAARRFGRDLARLHAAGADAFGAPWPGFIASLPLDNRPWPASRGWAEWYADRRILPFLRRAADAGTLGPRDVKLVEAVTGRITEIAGPEEPPSRIHGDCWSGNVLWGPAGSPGAEPRQGESPDGGRGWLIDPAAHGGHRETDLAMLALFGAPHLGRIIEGYTEAAPLADGWRSRVPLHQLHPLLVHVCLFGAGYRDAALDAARSARSL
jgi:fructosamine-3-kinase